MAPCSCRQVGWYLQSPVTSFSFMSTKPGRTARAKRTLDGWDGQTLTACVGYKYRVVILCHRWKLFAIQYSHQSLLFILCQPNLVRPRGPSGLWTGEMVKLSLRVLVINTEWWYFAIDGNYLLSNTPCSTLRIEFNSFLVFLVRIVHDCHSL